MPGHYGYIHLLRYSIIFMIRYLLPSFIFIASSLTASAGIADGWAAYEAGDYAKARALFLEDTTAEGFAAACRADLVIGGYFLKKPEESARALHDALDHCKEAIKREPDHADAAISYAVALGFESKRTKKPGYAKAGRQRLEALQQAYDTYGILHAALGGWHAAVSNAGFMARMYLGASRKKAQAHFSRAIELMPGDIGVRFEYIKFLAQGKKQQRKTALEEIALLASLPPFDAFDRFLQSRAQPIAEAIRSGSKRRLKQALAEATAFEIAASSDTLAAYAYKDEN